jgi:murein DD-endopeptidase MepM/ murein hydrolase activator NlpD
MKHTLVRLVLASVLLFVLFSLVPASALAQNNQGSAEFSNRGAAAISQAASIPSGNIIYVVRPGDTLARIAARYRVTIAAIMRANPAIRNPNVIYIGQRLVIPSGGTTTFSQANIYLIGLGSGGVGCGDQVVAVRRNIAPTPAPLTAALNQLLSLHTAYYGQSGLYNALHQSRLYVQSITRSGTSWKVYLRGTLTLAGVCDIPRVEAQLRQTALQFSTVTQVQFFVNGVPLAQALSQK